MLILRFFLVDDTQYAFATHDDVIGGDFFNTCTYLHSAKILSVTCCDFYNTFTSLLKDRKDPVAGELIQDAKKLQEANPELYPSQALLQAADSKGVDLKSRVKGEALEDNRDVMTLIRKAASSSRPQMPTLAS